MFGKGKVESVQTGVSEGRAERQAAARAAMRNGDGRGGLLGRLAGRNNGQPACIEGSLGENAGSAQFRQMQREMSATNNAGFSKADGNNGVW